MKLIRVQAPTYLRFGFLFAGVNLSGYVSQKNHVEYSSYDNDTQEVEREQYTYNKKFKPALDASVFGGIKVKLARVFRFNLKYELGLGKHYLDLYGIYYRVNALTVGFSYNLSAMLGH